MSRSTWTVKKKVGGNWVADGSIYRPNDDLDLVRKSTQQKIKLADGSDGYFLPSTKYTDDPIVLQWHAVGDTTHDKIKGYFTNADAVEITDHNADTYVGKFISFEATWLVGYSDNTYDITAIFEIMPALA